MADLESAILNFAESLGLSPRHTAIVGAVAAALVVVPPLLDLWRRIFPQLGAQQAPHDPGLNGETQKLREENAELLRISSTTIAERVYLYFNGVVNATACVGILFFASRAYSARPGDNIFAIPFGSVWPFLATTLCVGSAAVAVFALLFRPKFRAVTNIHVGFAISILAQLVFIAIFGFIDITRLYSLK
jgi:hypothetical protein